MKEQCVFIIEQHFKNNEDFLNKIIFSNNYFHLNGLKKSKKLFYLGLKKVISQFYSKLVVQSFGIF